MMSIGFMSESTGRPRSAAFAQWLHEIAGGDPSQAAIAIEVRGER